MAGLSVRDLRTATPRRAIGFPAALFAQPAADIAFLFGIRARRGEERAATALPRPEPASLWVSGLFDGPSDIVTGGSPIVRLTVTQARSVRPAEAPAAARSADRPATQRSPGSSARRRP